MSVTFVIGIGQIVVSAAFGTLNLSIACNALILSHSPDSVHTLNLSVPHLLGLSSPSMKRKK